MFSRALGGVVIRSVEAVQYRNINSRSSKASESPLREFGSIVLIPKASMDARVAFGVRAPNFGISDGKFQVLSQTLD